MIDNNTSLTRINLDIPLTPLPGDLPMKEMVSVVTYGKNQLQRLGLESTEYSDLAKHRHLLGYSLYQYIEPNVEKDFRYAQGRQSLRVVSRLGELISGTLNIAIGDQQAWEPLTVEKSAKIIGETVVRRSEIVRVLDYVFAQRSSSKMLWRNYEKRLTAAFMDEQD